MSGFNKMLEEYKTLVELQSFAEAQMLTIQELNKKIQKLEEEKSQMEKLVGTVVPIIGNDQYNLNIEVDTDEEEISKREIFKLKQHSMKRELTFEEAKRIEIYTKILASYKQKEKPRDVTPKKLSTDDLLKLAESNDGSQ